MDTTTITTSSKSTTNASNVYLFKNGYGMFVKTFDFPPNKGINNQPVELLDPPMNPVHGTFWIESTSNNTLIKSVRTKKTHTFEEKESTSIQELLYANIGENVELLIIDNVTQTKEWISGKIKSVRFGQHYSSENENTTAMETESTTVPVATSFHFSPVIPSTNTANTGNLALFQTTTHGTLAVSLSDIQSIRGETLKTKYQQKVFKNCLSIDYQNASESNVTGLMKYLTFGITWAPSYNLVILSSKDPTIKKLRLSSKAVILNDIENLNAENLFCIVGFPNISKFASVIDPIISGKTVQEFLDHLKECEASNRYPMNSMYAQQSVMSNSIMTQQICAPLSYTSNPSIPDDNNQPDTNVDDLHLYTFKNILLEKNERLMLPIFDIELSYKDVYHCKINTINQHVYSGYDEKKQYEEVWHSVEFENQSNFVWTTAPIVITQGEQEQQFIGQDTITYTTRGSSTFVNLTKALDVRIQLDEKITNTNPTRFTLFRVNYQTDQIEGKLSILNLKSEEIVVVINLSLTGKMSNYSIQPKKDHVKVNENVANQQHDIQWEIKVKPKQSVEIKYLRSYNKRV